MNISTFILSIWRFSFWLNTFVRVVTLSLQNCSFYVVHLFVSRWPSKVFKTDNSVSCVKFRGTNQICIGCADHSIQLFDIRYPRNALICTNEHEKAVSYVANSDEHIISASIDSTLRCWSEDGKCVRRYAGHINCRNFTGLSCTRNVIAVGSEDNRVYFYDKHHSEPSNWYAFEAHPDPNTFTASLTFHNDNEHLLAANSMGYIALLKLV